MAYNEIKKVVTVQKKDQKGFVHAFGTSLPEQKMTPLLQVNVQLYRFFRKGNICQIFEIQFFAYFDRLLCPSCIGEKKSLDTLNFRPDMML